MTTNSQRERIGQPPLGQQPHAAAEPRASGGASSSTSRYTDGHHRGSAERIAEDVGHLAARALDTPPGHEVIVIGSAIQADPSRRKRRHQPAAQLVGDPALVERQRLESHADRREAVGDRLDARISIGPRSSGAHAGSCLHRAPDLPDGLEHPVEILAVGDVDVDDRVRECLLRFASAVMVPFGNTCTAPSPSRTTIVRRLISSTMPVHAVDAREIADAHLILEDEEEARDDVAHEILRAEADRQAGDAGAGQDRHHVDRQLAQQHQHRRRTRPPTVTRRVRMPPSVLARRCHSRSDCARRCRGGAAGARSRGSRRESRSSRRP